MVNLNLLIKKGGIFLLPSALMRFSSQSGLAKFNIVDDAFSFLSLNLLMC